MKASTAFPQTNPLDTVKHLVIPVRLYLTLSCLVLREIIVSPLTDSHMSVNHKEGEITVTRNSKVLGLQTVTTRI
jgi:hypothetical protein